MTADEVSGMAKFFATKRRQYPPPRYELLHAMADSIEMFTRLYPKYRPKKGGGGDGDDGARTGGQTQPA